MIVSVHHLAWLLEMINHLTPLVFKWRESIIIFVLLDGRSVGRSLLISIAHACELQAKSIQTK